MISSPFALVIFGATGDLAEHKLLPALFSLYQQKLLPQDFYIIGFSRRLFSDEEFRNITSEELKLNDLNHLSDWKEFAKHLIYQQGDFWQESGYQGLIQKLESYDKKIGACITRFFYLATPPENYETILSKIDKTGLANGCGPDFAEASTGKHGSNKWTRVVIEKPFGKDLQTAKELDQKLAAIFDEQQIFRVDHYLGKETVQNMIAFRFANGIFEPVWNSNFIDHVQITWAEKKGIEGRGKFFDGVGILRDVAQNHLMQLLAAVAMEQPKSFAKEAIRDERAKVIQAIQCIEPENVSENVVRGQYAGYRLEKNVSQDSDTETFVAMKLLVDTPRFKGVPFYLRAGKKMPKDVVEIKIVFIQTCHLLFKEYGCPEIGNVLTIRIQPDEGIGLRVIAKTPVNKLALSTVDMKFSYEEEFKTQGADAYEKILLDIFAGDQMLFNRSDELSSSWEFITKILDGWRKFSPPLAVYDHHSWGPQEANKLIEKDGKKWLG